MSKTLYFCKKLSYNLVNNIKRRVKMTREDLFVEERCTKILLEIGLPANLQGFRYTRSAILHVIKDQELITAITKKLYPAVALDFNVVPSVVERSIRHAIDVAYIRKGLVGLNELFGLEVFDYRYKPSNSELIALVGEKILSELKQLRLNDSDDTDKNS